MGVATTKVSSFGIVGTTFYTFLKYIKKWWRQFRNM